MRAINALNIFACIVLLSGCQTNLPTDHPDWHAFEKSGGQTDIYSYANKPELRLEYLEGYADGIEHALYDGFLHISFGRSTAKDRAYARGFSNGSILIINKLYGDQDGP